MATQVAETIADDTRAIHRTQLCLAAFIDCDGLRTSARIRDLSRAGARIEASPPPPLSRPVVLSRGALTVTGQVVWRDRNRFGIRFDRAIDLMVWLPGRETARTQEDVDRAIAEIRRDLKSSGTNAMAQTEAPNLPARLAGELDYVGRMIESLRECVTGEPQIIARHSTKLPYFDQSIILLRQIAEILAAPNAEVAVNRLTDTDLHRRLTRSSI